jgi:hypothetical protein
MRQHGRFWVSSTAAGELQIRNVVWTDDAIEDVQNVFRYAFRFLYELVVSDEAISAAYYTNALQVWQHGMEIFFV